jgi:hypothetical protein
MKNVSDKSYRENQNSIILPQKKKKKIIYNLKVIFILCNDIEI